MDDDGFVIAKGRRRTAHGKQSTNNRKTGANDRESKLAALQKARQEANACTLRRAQSIVDEINRHIHFYQQESCQKAIDSLLASLPTPPNELRAYGIGSVALSSKARKQMAFLLCLCKHLPTLTGAVTLSDPILSDAERQLLRDHFAVSVHDETENDEARHVALTTTLFFMPFCPRGLYHNVLLANRDTLVNVALLGNSFARYELIGKRPLSLVESIATQCNETPLPVSELRIDDDDRCLNDQSLHTFEDVDWQTIDASVVERNLLDDEIIVNEQQSV